MSALLPVGIDCCNLCEEPSSVLIPGPAGPPGPSGSSNFLVYQTVALARAADAPTTLPSMMITQGAAAADDSMGKIWLWMPASMEVDDGSPFTVVILPANIDIADPGRWEQFI